MIGIKHDAKVQRREKWRKDSIKLLYQVTRETIGKRYRNTVVMKAEKKIKEVVGKRKCLEHKYDEKKKGSTKRCYPTDETSPPQHQCLANFGFRGQGLLLPPQARHGFISLQKIRQFFIPTKQIGKNLTFPFTNAEM